MCSGWYNNWVNCYCSFMVVKHLMIYAVKIECLPNAREFEMLKPQHLIREQKEHCYHLLVIRLFQSVYCSVSLYCALCMCSAFPLHVTSKILTFPALYYIYSDNVEYLRVLAKWQGTRGYLPSFLVYRSPLMTPCHVISLAFFFGLSGSEKFIFVSPTKQDSHRNVCNYSIEMFAIFIVPNLNLVQRF